uniref:G-protein coupled receptors family 3 profile domain-containing protein n=1 Tax=Vombatus ursinus TaxID=29139 RepID=A0A4X2K3I2_VOMUR
MCVLLSIAFSSLFLSLSQSLSLSVSLSLCLSLSLTFCLSVCVCVSVYMLTFSCCFLCLVMPASLYFSSHFRALRKHYQHFLVLQFAVDEINNNPHLLPNITLGYHLLNNFHHDRLAVESALMWLSGMGPTIPNYSCDSHPNSVAVIGGMSSTLSMSMATILKLYKVPQVTYGLFDLLLAGKVQYPYVYQIGSKESTLHLAFIQLMLHFDWTWVRLVLSDNVKGENFFSDLKEEMDRNGLCVAFKESVPPNFKGDEDYKLSSRIIASSSNVIFIYGDTDSLQELAFAFISYVLYGKMLVATTAWDFSFDSNLEMLTYFHGTILFSHSQMEILGFTDFVRSLNPSVNSEDMFLRTFFESVFNCRLSEKSHVEMSYTMCPEGVSLTDLPFINFDKIIMELSSNVYNAVYLVAHALHQMLQSEAKETSDLGRNPYLSWKVTFLFHSWAYHRVLSTFNCYDKSCGEGSRVAVETYDILNFKYFSFQTETLVKVGEVTPHDQGFSINEEDTDWPEDFSQTPTSMCSLYCGPGFKKTKHESQPICCFDCTPCPEGKISNQTGGFLKKKSFSQSNRYWRDRCLPKIVTFLAYEEPLGMTLACAALCFSLLTALVLGVFMKHRDTPIVKANNRSLSYTLLVSLSLCFLCSLLFIGHPNTTTCLLQQTTFAVVFTVAIASILAKNITVILAFRATKPGSKLRRWLGSTTSYSLILIQKCLCGIWLGAYPAFLEMDVHAEPGFVIIQCNEGSIITFYCVLGYMALLALGSFTMAFLARNLPDTFNEAKFLTFSMLVFCNVWISFLPAYQSTKGKAMVAVEVFSILASSAGILTCIFAPKCYVILLRPDRNTLEILKIKANL